MSATGLDGAQRLLQRALQGDRKAVAELYQQHGEAIRRFLRRFDPSLDAADIDDLTQTVFVAVLRRRPDSQIAFEGRSSARTYLLVMARRLAVRHRERDRRWRRALADSTARPPIDPGPGPAQTMAGRDLLAKLAGATAQLTPLQREAVLSVLRDGAAADRSPTHRRRLCDARRRLRALLHDPAEKDGKLSTPPSQTLAPVH